MSDFVERVMEREASRSPLLRTVEPRRRDDEMDTKQKYSGETNGD